MINFDKLARCTFALIGKTEKNVLDCKFHLLPSGLQCIFKVVSHLAEASLPSFASCILSKALPPRLLFLLSPRLLF